MRPSTVFLFPGHSVRVGMGRGWSEASSGARRLLARADEALAFPLTRLMFEGPLETLEGTRYAQAATVACGLAATEALREGGVQADLVAGRSVGEFTAAAVAGVIGVEEVLRLVWERGRLFEESCRRHPGGLIALHAFPASEAAALCARARGRTGRLCVPASYNTPTRTVLSGEREALETAALEASSRGAEVLRLKVSGPFHSVLMAEAAAGLRGLCRGLEFRDPLCGMATGVDGEIHASGRRIKANLCRQVVRPVLWERMARRLLEAGGGRFIEIGPGQGMAAMLREIEPAASACTAEGPADLAALTKPGSFVYSSGHSTCPSAERAATTRGRSAASTRSPA